MKTWIFRSLALGLGTLVALVAVECALRIVLGRTNADLFIFRADTTRAKLMRPNVRAMVYGRPIETNGAGFRARREYTARRSPGVRRIVVIGDSFAVCAGVPFEQIATTRLEGLLNEAYAPLRFEVYNLGVGGHEILHHLATVKEVALGYAPDLVLIFVFPYNDFEVSTYDGHRRCAEAISRGPGPEADRCRGGRWVDSLHVVKVLAGAGSTLKWLARGIPAVDRMLGPSSHDRLLAWLSTPTPGRDRSMAALREIREVLGSAGVSVRAYVLPANFGSYALQRPFYDVASHLIEDAGFPTLSLLDAFAATDKPPASYRVNVVDSHPDAEYGAIAARAVFDDLRRTGAIDRLKDAQRKGDAGSSAGRRSD